MIKDADKVGKTEFLGAMARGGGNNERQAKELLKLGNGEFAAATNFIEQLAGEPALFHEIAKIVNLVHASVIKSSGRRSAPTDVTGYYICHDVEATLKRAIKITTEAERRDRLSEIRSLIKTVKLDILPPTT